MKVVSTRCYPGVYAVLTFLLVKGKLLDFFCVVQPLFSPFLVTEADSCVC